MLELHAQHPQYGFDKHMGYGTQLHRDAILSTALSHSSEALHPQCGANKAGIMSFAGKKTGGKGDLAEAHLLKKGYQILRRNYETKLGEIDIIAQADETVVFVEVKTLVKQLGRRQPGSQCHANQAEEDIRVARAYISGLSREPYCRFDVIAVRTAPEVVSSILRER